MDTEDLRTLQQWVLSWRGSGARFEVVPVVRSAQTQQVVQPFLRATRVP